MAVPTVLVVDDQHVGGLLGQDGRPVGRAASSTSAAAKLAGHVVGRPRRPCPSRGSRGRPGGRRRGRRRPRPAPPSRRSARVSPGGEQSVGDLAELAPGGGDQHHPVPGVGQRGHGARRWRWPRRRDGRGRTRRWPLAAPYGGRRPTGRSTGDAVRAVPASEWELGRLGQRQLPGDGLCRRRARVPFLPLTAKMRRGSNDRMVRSPGRPADHLDRLGAVVPVADVGPELPVGAAHGQAVTRPPGPRPAARSTPRSARGARRPGRPAWRAEAWRAPGSAPLLAEDPEPVPNRTTTAMTTSTAAR